MPDPRAAACAPAPGHRNTDVDTGDVAQDAGQEGVRILEANLSSEPGGESCGGGNGDLGRRAQDLLHLLLRYIMQVLGIS